MKRENLYSIAITIIVILLLVGYYMTFRGRGLDLITLNKSVAIASVIAIGLSFLLGPLGRASPWIKKRMEYRKPFGLIGFGLAALHVATSILLPQYKPFFDLNAPALAFGAIAFAMFTFISGTSTQGAFNYLGEERWKQIQRTGYIAYVLVILHFALVEAREFGQLSLSQAPPAMFIALLFALIVLFARAISIALPQKVKTPRTRSKA